MYRPDSVKSPVLLQPLQRLQSYVTRIERAATRTAQIHDRRTREVEREPGLRERRRGVQATKRRRPTPTPAPQRTPDCTQTCKGDAHSTRAGEQKREKKRKIGAQRTACFFVSCGCASHATLPCIAASAVGSRTCHCACGWVRCTPPPHLDSLAPLFPCPSPLTRHSGRRAQKKEAEREKGLCRENVRS